jgi:hypothetical protein
MEIYRFFKPSWKKLYWFFIVFFIAEVYSTIILDFIPSGIAANFINFILNPATIILESLSGFEPQLIPAVGGTFNVMWQYLLATICAKEISKDKE